MARRSRRVLDILRSGFLTRFAGWEQEFGRGLPLYNRIRQTYRGLAPHEVSTLYTTGISAVNAGALINLGQPLFIGSIPTIPGLPSPFGADRRFLYEVVVEFRVQGVRGLSGPLYRRRFIESDSVLNLLEIERRSHAALFDQFRNKKHYAVNERFQIYDVNATVQSVAARF